MREAVREIIDDLPDALIAAFAVAAFIACISAWAALGAGA